MEKLIYRQIKGVEYHDCDPVGHCPFLICQICGKQIKHKENSGMVFSDDEGKGIFAHKDCMSKEDLGRKGNIRFDNSIELEKFFYDLLYNSQIKPKKVDD